jgi:hypothetical protein
MEFERQCLAGIEIAQLLVTDQLDCGEAITNVAERPVIKLARIKPGTLVTL